MHQNLAQTTRKQKSLTTPAVPAAALSAPLPAKPTNDKKEAGLCTKRAGPKAEEYAGGNVVLPGRAQRTTVSTAQALFFTVDSVTGAFNRLPLGAKAKSAVTPL